MKHSARSLVLALLAALMPRIAAAQAADSAALDSLIARHVQEHGLIGLSVGVMVGGRVVLAKGYGVRDLASRAPVTPQTTFAIGSVSKQFTCSAALLLAQEGRLSMDQRVARWYPDLTRAGDVTLGQLGAHTSGYRDYYPLDFVDRRMAVSRAPDEIIHDYGTMPLDFEPDSRYSYSNTGFLILGRVVERVSGEPMGRIFERRFFGPLGMRQTRLDPPHGQPDQATGYTSYLLADPEVATPEGAGWLGAAGGIWSTPTDLMTWDLALMDGRVLDARSFQAMSTPRALSGGRTSTYGCGQSIRDRGAALVLSHGGAVSGFVSRNMLVPATRAAVVLLSNADFAAIDDLGEAILARLMPAGAIPVVQGLPAREAALVLYQQLRAGSVERSMLSEEYSALLSPERLRVTAQALARYGDAREVRVTGRYERGALEVAELTFIFANGSADGLMYRTPDGRIEEFLLFRP